MLVWPKMKAKRLRKHQGNLVSFPPGAASAELTAEHRMLRVCAVTCPRAAAGNQRFSCSKKLLGR